MRSAEPHSLSGPDRERLSGVCERALEWASERDYAGWDPYDGLNSPYLATLCRNWLTRLVGIHLVEKAPINLRPLLSVPRERNPKGIALFAMAHLHRYRTTGEATHLSAAESLLVWLRDNRSPTHDAGWGYNFDWQNGRKFFLPASHPSIVVSVFGGRAFLEHHRVTGDRASLAVARETAAFVRSDVSTETVDGRTVYHYTPDDSFVVVNANALAAGFFAAVGEAAGDEDLLAHASELVAFVVDQQLDDGAWYYAVPPEESHLGHDNFHTGFVLESLGRYLTVVDDRAVERAYDEGMRFYAEHLFEADGAPRFEHDRSHPHDAHAAAQGIRTFALDGDPEHEALALHIASWAVERLWDQEGYFYRRRGAIVDDRTPYMRWSQAWLCYGLATLLEET